MKIRKWNHAAIAASNPGVAMPDLDITVVHRSDSSGTTFRFVSSGGFTVKDSAVSAFISIMLKPTAHHGIT